jgi:hypothetical protein
MYLCLRVEDKFSAPPSNRRYIKICIVFSSVTTFLAKAEWLNFSADSYLSSAANGLVALHNLTILKFTCSFSRKWLFLIDFGVSPLQVCFSFQTKISVVNNFFLSQWYVIVRIEEFLNYGHSLSILKQHCFGNWKCCIFLEYCDEGQCPEAH